MKKYSILLIATLLFALNQNQVKIIRYCYKIGIQYGLANTLAGICYIESKGGKYLLNPTTEDYGIAGINIRTGLRYMNMKDTYYHRLQLASILIKNNRLNLRIAIHELLYWKKRKVYWYSYVSAYNRGNLGSYKYARKVSKAIKYLKKEKIIH